MSISYYKYIKILGVLYYIIIFIFRRITEELLYSRVKVFK